MTMTRDALKTTSIFRGYTHPCLTCVAGYTLCTTWLRLFLHEPNKNSDQSLINKINECIFNRINLNMLYHCFLMWCYFDVTDVTSPNLYYTYYLWNVLLEMDFSHISDFVSDARLLWEIHSRKTIAKKHVL
jgi:hypothetical protein